VGKAGWDEDSLTEVSRVEYDDLVSAPAAPPSGQLSHYAKNGRFFQKTSADVEKVVGPQVAAEVELSSIGNTILGPTIQDWINQLYKSTNSQKVTYLESGEIDYTEIFNSSSQVTENRRAKIQLNYTNDNVTSEVITLYDTNGTSALKTITLTHSYTGDEYNKTTTVVS